jgi:hypothetical protein
MSDNPNTFTALNAVREAWQTQHLSKAAFTNFDEGVLLAAQDMLHGVEYGALGLIMTQDEWEAMPINIRDNATFKSFPRPPVVPIPEPRPPEANAPANASAGRHQGRRGAPTCHYARRQRAEGDRYCR